MPRVMQESRLPSVSEDWGRCCGANKCLMGLAGSVCPFPTGASAGPQMHGFYPCIIHHLSPICPLNPSSDSTRPRLIGLAPMKASQINCRALLWWCLIVAECDKWEWKLVNLVQREFCLHLMLERARVFPRLRPAVKTSSNIFKSLELAHSSSQPHWFL